MRISDWSSDVCSSDLLISSPDTATPPALAALPGAYISFASRKTCAPARSVGMFAPSLIAMQPFATSVLASSPFSSFCVAQGRATSHATPHGVLPGTTVAPLSTGERLDGQEGVRKG